MEWIRKASIPVAVLALAAAGWGFQKAPAGATDATMAPKFEVDPFWPKPLPNHWILGSTIGVTVDSRDHVWIIHRGNGDARTEMGAAQDPPTSECCKPAPNILEFDQEGNLLRHFGGPGVGYDWPASNHGITADPMDNLWIGGNAPNDGHILKFSQDGKFLQQFGHPGANKGSQDKENFGRVAKISFDAKANEAYVADGYGNKRVAVIDMTTGAFKRFWGAYGRAPDDADLGPYKPDAPPSPQFGNPVHCAEPSNDGFVYVCDRANDRIQVFRNDGTFVQELIVAPQTLGDGSAWDIAFSKDPGQKFLYLADGKNMKVYIIERKTMKLLTSFGDGGRQPGQFFGVHSIATDSKGNIYTTETYEGKRVQKFVLKGLRPVTTQNQGVAWPTATH